MGPPHQENPGRALRVPLGRNQGLQTLTALTAHHLHAHQGAVELPRQLDRAADEGHRDGADQRGPCPGRQLRDWIREMGRIVTRYPMKPLWMAPPRRSDGPDDWKRLGRDTRLLRRCGEKPSAAAAGADRQASGTAPQQRCRSGVRSGSGLRDRRPAAPHASGAPILSLPVADT